MRAVQGNKAKLVSYISIMFLSLGSTLPRPLHLAPGGFGWCKLLSSLKQQLLVN